MVYSLWVKITSQANKGNFFVGGYSRLPNQEEPVDEVLLLQLRESSCLQSLIWLGDFSNLMSAGKRAHQGVNSPGHSWSVLRIIF